MCMARRRKLRRAFGVICLLLKEWLGGGIRHSHGGGMGGVGGEIVVWICRMVVVLVEIVR